MIDNLVQWATLLSPIISVIAIIVALHVARSSSKDAQKQIAAIHFMLRMRKQKRIAIMGQCIQKY